MAYHCEDAACPYCALHCAYCGEEALLLDWEAQRMRCPRCGQEEDMPSKTFIEVRQRQALEFSGRSIAEWKAQARQLSASLRYRWRSTMSYLDPVSSALISLCDDESEELIKSMPKPVSLQTYLELMAELIACAKANKAYYQAFADANPGINSGEHEGPAFLDDWF